jgi:sugar phosphate isomerase/epimerase
MAASRWRADGEPITSKTPTAVLQRVLAASRSRGLRVPTLDSSCQLVQADTAGRSATLQQGQFTVDLAVDLGAQAVRVFGGPLPVGHAALDELAAAADVLGGIARYAATCGIRILLETHDSAWSRSANAVALIEAAGEPNAGILYDVLHPYRMGE